MTPPRPDLSVIIVNWNTRHRLTECLRSLADDLTSLVRETIVVDNASSDGSAEAVRRDFGWARIIQNDANAGFAAASNQGMAAARGRYLLLLNSDTVVRPGAVDRAVRYMDADPGAGLAGAKLLNLDGTFQGSYACFPTLSSELLNATTLGVRWISPYYPSPRPNERAPLDVDWVRGPFMLVRRAAWAAVGGLDPAYGLYSEDTDWCYRMRRHGWRVVYLPAVEILHVHGASTRQRPIESVAQLYQSKIRFFAVHHGPAAARRLRRALDLVFVARLTASRLLAGLGLTAESRQRWRDQAVAARAIRHACASAD